MKIATTIFFMSSLSFAAASMPSIPRNIPKKVEIDFTLFPLLQESMIRTENQGLVGTQIDYRKKAVAVPGLNIRDNGKLFSEGNGSRGGGSGVFSQDYGSSNVRLLDIYRSENRDLFPLFYAIDGTYYDISKAAGIENAEPAAEEIYQKVMERVSSELPMLAKFIRAAESQIPFQKWTASTSALPLIGDYIGEVPLKISQRHVQIAYRRANQVILDEPAYRLMDGLNRAALRLHEYIYASSGLKDSVQIQRLVTLLMSRQIVEDDFSNKAAQIFFELQLLPMVMVAPSLPEGVQLTNKQPSWPDVCGPVKRLSVQPDKSGILTIEIDPNSKHIMLKDLNIPRNFSKLAEIQLTAKEMQSVWASIYLTKGAMSLKYPLYLYPSQSIPVDVACANSLSGKLNGYEVGLNFQSERNSLELATAAAEAQYIRAQKNFILEPSAFRYDEFVKAEEKLREYGRASLPTAVSDLVNGQFSLITDRLTFDFSR